MKLPSREVKQQKGRNWKGEGKKKLFLSKVYLFF